MKLKKDLSHKNRLLYMVFFIGFLAGFILMNMGRNVFLERIGFLDEYALCQLRYMEIDSSGLFVYVLKKRLGTAVCIMLLASTYLGIVTVYAFGGWLGVSFGMLLEAALLRYGLKGILLLATAAFPHYLLYVPAFAVLLGSARELCAVIYFPARCRAVYSADKKEEIRKRIFLFLLVTGVVIIGAWLESYVNPKLVTGLLKIF